MDATVEKIGLRTRQRLQQNLSFAPQVTGATWDIDLRPGQPITDFRSGLGSPDCRHRPVDVRRCRHSLQNDGFHRHRIEQKQSSACLAREMLMHVAEWHAQGSVFHVRREVATMNAKLGASLKGRLWIAGAMLAMLTFGPYASANVIRIHFSGPAGSGYADLTLTNDADASSNYPDAGDLAPATRYDPEGVKHISGATGMFNGNAITGVQPLNGAPLPPPPI